MRLTQQCFERIVKLVETGWSIPNACRSEGITYSLFRKRCQERPKWQERYLKADSLRFQHRAEQMEALVAEHANKNWQAAMSWLERSLPHRWALKDVHREAVTELTDTHSNTVMIQTVTDIEYDELSREPDCVTLPDGGLELKQNTLTLRCYRMTENQRLRNGS